MIIKHKIAIFFIIFFLCFGIFSFKNFLKNFEIIFAFGDGKNISQYNKSLEMAKNGNFQNALKNLPENLKNFEERLFELKWDIFFKEKYASGQILEQYEKSLVIEKNERISYKISLLKDEKSEKNSQQNEENFSEKSQEIQEKQQEIAEDQKNRKDFLNPNRSSLGNFERDLKNLKELLKEENISEVKDW